jgi:hypothetical protein
LLHSSKLQSTLLLLWNNIFLNKLHHLSWKRAKYFWKIISFHVLTPYCTNKMNRMDWKFFSNSRSFFQATPIFFTI